MVVTPVPLCPSSSEAPGVLPVFLLPQTSDYKSPQWYMLLYPNPNPDALIVEGKVPRETSSLQTHPYPSSACALVSLQNHIGGA